MYRKMCLLTGMRRGASSVAAPALTLALPAWETTAEQQEEAVHSVKDKTAALIKSGEGGVIQCVGAKSAIAVLKGMALAEQELSGGADRAGGPWGHTSALQLVVEKKRSDYHTYAIHVTDKSVDFPQQSRLVDVIDKAELQRDIITTAQMSPSGYYDEVHRELDFDRNSPEYNKPWTLSVQEVLDNLVKSRLQQCIIRGMGPSLANTLHVIAEVQDITGGPLPIGILKLESDAASVATFKENIANYFERGLQHVADGDQLPGKRHDGRVVLPPEDYVDDDHFLCAFTAKLGSA